MENQTLCLLRSITVYYILKEVTDPNSNPKVVSGVLQIESTTKLPFTVLHLL
jgi:hypothetical protein